MTDMLPRVLKALPPEPWGARMRRARSGAGLRLDDVAEALSALDYEASAATISRLEKLDAPPTDHRRTLASIAALLYGVEHTELGLDAADVPVKAWRALTTADQRERSTMWYRKRPGHAHLRAVA